ncbi:MAG: hypothetical protein JKX88_03605 [Marinicaulis sp.]|nr:hypothetical protein [Marinicaulis sp.]
MKHLKLAIVACAFAVLPGCVKLTLAWADLTARGEEAAPAALGAFNGTGSITNINDWESVRAPMLREALQEFVYGHFPDDHSLNVLSRKVLDEAAFDGDGHLVEYQLQADLTFGGVQRQTDAFYMDVITPVGVEDAPIILIQTFCPRWKTIPHPAIHRPEGARGCDGGGIGSAIMTYVFGRYIATPPIEMILSVAMGSPQFSQVNLPLIAVRRALRSLPRCQLVWRRINSAGGRLQPGPGVSRSW